MTHSLHAPSSPHRRRPHAAQTDGLLSHTGGPTRLVNNGPCAVYLLVHSHAQRFKIGLSQDAWLRGQNLREASSIHWARSLQVLLPSRMRARQVEQMLQKALAAFRLDLSQGRGAAWDGSTEWFSIAALRHAVCLLQVTPVDDDGLVRAQLIPASRDSLMPADTEATATPADIPTTGKNAEPPAAKGKHDPGQYNLEQVARMSEVLFTLSWRYRVELVQGPVSGGAASPRAALIHINGIRENSEEVSRDRFQVMAPELWALRSKAQRTCRLVVPLVRLIRYCPERPDALTLVINDLQLIRRLPEGLQIVAQWRALCRQLQACGLSGPG